jgi:hypothetical protein
MNKLLKVALIGGGAVVLSAVCFDFGTIYAIRNVKDISPEGYDSIMETLSDMLKYRKFNAVDKARANFVFRQAIT